jgi:hypothetical protein
LLFLTSGLSTGVGLALLTLFQGGDFGSFLLMTGLAFVVLDLVLWIVFLRLSIDSTYLRATSALRRPPSFSMTVVLGHLLPMFLMSLLILLPLAGLDDENISPQIILVIAGAAIIVGGVSQKAGIILRAGYLRGIVMAQEKGNPER